MSLSLLRRTGAVLALTMLVGATATAQGSGKGSDHTGPGGSGGGVGGSLGVGVSEPGAGGATGFGAGSVGNQAGIFGGAGATGVPVSNPATGTTVVVPQNVAQALGQVLGGQGAGASATELTNALMGGGAIPAATANALVAALAQLGQNASFDNLVTAVNAYNAAVNSLNGPVPAALLAVRSALAGMQ